MRTNLLTLAAVAFLYASCIQSECLSLESTEIGFDAQIGVPTKSLFSDNDFSNTAMFDVWGFYSQDGTFSEFSETSTSNFMNGLTVERYDYASNSSLDAWRNRYRRYYWPLGGKIGFYALYPSEISRVHTPEYKGRGLQIDNYTISLVNKFTDLMYSYAVGSVESTILSLKFKHALSQVEFNVQLDEELSDHILYVTEIDLINVDLSGQFNYVQTEKEGKWSNNTDNQTESIKYSDNRMQLSDQMKAYSAAMVMLPQTLSSETSVRIKYNLIDNQGNSVAGELVKQLDYIQPEWKISTKYSYLLSFSLDEAKSTPVADVRINSVSEY